MLTPEKQWELFERIQEVMQPFGSRAYGCNNENSDYDFICSEEQLQKLKKFLDANNHIYDDLYHMNRISAGGFGHIPNNTLHNSGNIKFTIDGKVVNIISFKEDKIKYAKDIAKTLIEFSKNSKLINSDNLVLKKFLENKEARIRITLGFFDAMFSTKYSDIEINADEIPF